MSWKNKLNGKASAPHPDRAWNVGQGWMVKDLAEARQFLKDVHVTHYRTKAGVFPVAQASDMQVKQILAGLNVKLGSYIEDPNSPPATPPVAIMDLVGNKKIVSDGAGKVIEAKFSLPTAAKKDDV